MHTRYDYIHPYIHTRLRTHTHTTHTFCTHNYTHTYLHTRIRTHTHATQNRYVHTYTLIRTHIRVRRDMHATRSVIIPQCLHTHTLINAYTQTHATCSAFSAQLNPLPALWAYRCFYIYLSPLPPVTRYGIYDWPLTRLRLLGNMKKTRTAHLKHIREETSPSPQSVLSRERIFTVLFLLMAIFCSTVCFWQLSRLLNQRPHHIVVAPHTTTCIFRWNEQPVAQTDYIVLAVFGLE